MIKQEAAAIKVAKLRDIPVSKNEKSPALTTAPAQHALFMSPVTTANYSASFTSPAAVASFSSPTFGMSSFTTNTAPSFGSLSSATTQSGTSASVSAGLNSADSSFTPSSTSFAGSTYNSFYSPPLPNTAHTITMAGSYTPAPLTFTPFAPVSASALTPAPLANEMYSMSATNHGHSAFETDMGLADYESDDGI